ncbi:MAG TPA: PLP-dependent aminotransferase family protein [Actinospica sp.]|jgi:DNA-binding transcriptional MocR family regulator|nr:PLP-dependent aminotransferase family protein [Actinospica sp.]
MDGAASALGPQQLARLLGPWRVVGDTGRQPARTALAERIRALVLDGRIAVGARLPAERPLSETLQVSRTTITAAYALLVEQGYAAARRGSGTFTALPERLLARPTGGFQDSDDPDLIDLSCAGPSAPTAELRAATAWAAERLHLVSGNAFRPYGLPELREAIAQRYTARGLPTEPGQILVTSGAQGAITLVARLLVRQGDRVVLEGPTYANVIDSFTASRARLYPVPLDETTGWEDAATGRIPMAQAASRLSPRLVYSIPHFHNPTGMLMPPEHAGPLARAARRAGAWLLADETITDIALDVPVPPPFAAGVSPADAERLLVCGSLGKSYWGGIRVGWLRAPSRVVHELAAARASLDLASPVIDQLIAVAVLSEGMGVDEERRAEARVGRAALEAALRELTPDWTWRRPPGGLSLWVQLAEGEESTSLVYRAGTHGLVLQSGPRFGADPGTYERFLRLPYSQTPEMLREGMRRLAAARRTLGPVRASEARRDLVA